MQPGDGIPPGGIGEEDEIASGKITAEEGYAV
jgi:hypothetical protein